MSTNGAVTTNQITLETARKPGKEDSHFDPRPALIRATVCAQPKYPHLQITAKLCFSPATKTAAVHSRSHGFSFQTALPAVPEALWLALHWCREIARSDSSIAALHHRRGRGGRAERMPTQPPHPPSPYRHLCLIRDQ